MTQIRYCAADNVFLFAFASSFSLIFFVSFFGLRFLYSGLIILDYFCNMYCGLHFINNNRRADNIVLGAICNVRWPCLETVAGGTSTGKVYIKSGCVACTAHNRHLENANAIHSPKNG